MTDTEFKKLNPCLFIEKGERITKEMLLKQAEFFKTHTFIFDKLTPYEVEILKLRLGLIDGKIATLQEVGDKFGVTSQCISIIQSRIFKKLTSPQILEVLKSYDDSINEKLINEIVLFIKRGNIKIVKNTDINPIRFIKGEKNDYIKDALQSAGIYTIAELIKYLGLHKDLTEVGLDLNEYKRVILVIDDLIDKNYLEVSNSVAREYNLYKNMRNDRITTRKYNLYKSVANKTSYHTEFTKEEDLKQTLTSIAMSLTDEQKSTNINNLDISKRTYHCLKRTHLNTVGEILQYNRMNRKGLLNIINLGEKSAEELIREIYELGKKNELSL